MGVGGQRHILAALSLGKRPVTHFTADWVGPRAGLDECGKSRPLPEFDPRTFQSVIIRCTDYAIPDHSCVDFSEIFVDKSYKNYSINSDL